jgi:hypothetical protein
MGDVIWRDNKVTHKARRAARSAHVLRRGMSGGEGRRRRGIVSDGETWRGVEKTREARRAARPAHSLRRGAERGRGEKEEGQRERRCDMAR